MRTTTSWIRCVRPRTTQRGVVTVVGMLFLIATVVASLALMLRISSNTVIDNQRQSDSTAAFFIAESGLEAAAAELSNRLAGNFTNTSCTDNLPASGVGRGNFVLSGISEPAACDNSNLATRCSKCTVQSVGTVGIANRTLRYGFDLAHRNGTACNAVSSDCRNASTPLTWKLDLRNYYATPAIGVFSLAARRQGNNTGANCTNSACKLEWTINSQNGNNSIGSMGNAVPISSGGTYTIYQQLSDNYNLAEVGALFTGPGSGPALTGRYSGGVPVNGGAAYWNQPNNGSGGTVGKDTDTAGSTNDGTWTNPTTDTCTTTPAPGTKQNCTSWCYGGDTLVFGFAGSSASLADKLSSVTFDTSGQMIPLSPVPNAKYPTEDTGGAPVNVYSEIWYAHNPDYLSNTSGATSGGVVKGSIGATFNAYFTGNSMKTVGNVSGVLHIGDTLTCTATPTSSCPTFNSAGPVTISDISGSNYTVSAACATNCGSSSPPVNYAYKTSSTKLDVTNVNNGYISVGDDLNGTGVLSGTTVTGIVGSGNVIGTYTLSAAQTVASTTLTADGTTIHVTGGTVPSDGVPTANTLLSVRGGTGVFQAQTRVQASPTPTATVFKVDKKPATRLQGATVCGGTCAFFQHGASASTGFSINKSAGTAYWAAGFLCLKNVDPLQIMNVESSVVVRQRWTEPVQ
jgi:hypothetical protein